MVKRADGYYCQFCIKADVNQEVTPTGNTIGLDVGLTDFYTDSNGEKVANPRHLRKAEKRLKQLQRKVSKSKKGSNNRKKAVNRLGRQHLKVSRQRKDFVVKTARCVMMSNDFVAYEDLKVSNMVKNRRLAKSISDVGWYSFRQWLEYFAVKFGKVAIVVPPQYTSQDCAKCGTTIKKTLSQRTHICTNCGYVEDRDVNAAINILTKGLKMMGYLGYTVGHTEIEASGEKTLYLNMETYLSKVAH